MNNNRRLVFQLLRLYSSKSFPKNTGVRGRFTFEKTMQETENDIEEFNPDDMDAYESDFMNVGKSYTMHQREMKKSKERLKQRIVKSKYFKEEEPRFLTFTEKDQIQKLHASNPEEWTPERLSESFPALPEAIRRVLRSKWTPKSVDKIIKYDSVVIENWKNLKTGKLVVNPMLHEHLMKFKNRKITLCSRETLSEFIPPKMKFPKPKSTLFSNIVQGYIDEKQPVCDQKLIPSKDKVNENGGLQSTIENNNLEKSIQSVNNSSIIQNNKYKLTASNKVLTHNEFMKDQLKQLYNTSPEVGITLLQTYRQYVESKSTETANSNALSNATEKINERNNTVSPRSTVTTDSNVLSNTVEEINEKDNTVSPRDTSTENVLVVRKKDTESKVTSALNMEHDSSLDTFIKERRMCIDVKNEYIKPIKIPKNVWKHGMTYRVKDCYYDYDGEFLYRVPELLT
nr:uncharacterized protein LOC116434729 [Nomia melanderi]XP_031849244.1 uncharacterized protein LOC116434729 [Nomia melanderi]XP_031849245.1 uncharacterized protein LOC116434729 [Nomia melanderi]